MTTLTETPQIRESVQALVQTLVTQGRDPELAVVLIRASTQALKESAPRGGSLTQDQVDFLIDSGTFTPDRLQAAQERVKNGELAALERHTALQTVAEALSTTELAARLHIDPSSVRHRLAKGTLYSFMVGGNHCYPLWQFVESPDYGILPGLPTLLRALPDDMHPASVRGFMLTPQDDLRVNGKPTTPRGWLLSGGDTAEVVGLLNSLLMS